jgi:cell division inhibitor SepF
MSLWRKTLVYLGLVEESDDEARTATAPTAGDDRVEVAADDRDDVRRLQRVAEPAGRRPDALSESMRARVHVVAVTDFDPGAVDVARPYRMGQPVLFDLADVDAGTARRVLDFVAGVTYALHGSLHRYGMRAFMIVPEGAQLSATEHERLAALGYGPVNV